MTDSDKLDLILDVLRANELHDSSCATRKEVWELDIASSRPPGRYCNCWLEYGSV